MDGEIDGRAKTVLDDNVGGGEEMVESERRHEVGYSPHCRGLYTSAQRGSAQRTH